MYLALGAEIALGETFRHTTPELLPLLNDYRLSELAVRLQAVLDCRTTTLLGLESTELWHYIKCDVPRLVAEAAIARGVEGILVPSATRLGDNLIVFVEQLHPESSP